MDPAQLSEPFGAGDEDMDLDGLGGSEISHQIILVSMTGLIHRSDRAKKHSTPQNEEARFLLHPLTSVKKKIPKDLREGMPSLNNSTFNSWYDAQLLNYSNSCGVKFLGSLNHKSKCFRMISQ